MLKHITTVAAAAVLSVAPSWAASPIMSGKYLYTWSENCEPQSGGYAGYARSTVIATFDSSTGMVSYSGFATEGPPLALAPVSGTAAFSITKTTLTLDTTVYKAFFSAKKGVVTAVTGIAVVPGDAGSLCADQVLLTLQ